jgi:uncharacterized membrane protein YagU involved in acid resistance
MHHFYLTEIDFLTICRAIGLIGFILYATGFFCLSVGRLDSSRPLYFGLVFAASCCVMISLWADFNLSAALIQGFYILMSAGGILRRRHRIVGTA